MLSYLAVMANGEKKKKWHAVQIPEGLVSEVEKYLKTEDARKRGFHTISGFVVHAVRKELGLG